MTDAQIVELIKEMLDSGAIGLYPQRVDNGADCIVCPACAKSTKVQGYAYGMHLLDEGEHYDGCQLMKLRACVEEGAGADEIIDRTRELIRQDAIGLYGQRVNNGGDFISCPACRETTTIQGYADSIYPLDAGKHADGCEAIALAEAILARSQD